MNLRREKDIEQLRRVALTQQVQIEKLLEVLADKCHELDAIKGTSGLQGTLAGLERITQKAVAEVLGPDANAPTTPKEKKAREAFGATKQPNLRVDEEVFDLDDADKVCTSCGGALFELEGEDDTSEMIDVIEVSYRLVKVTQRKYACRCGGCLETAIGPDRVTKGGRYSLAFGTKVAVDKYLDHLPLARQVRIMSRHGLEVTTQTLWDQIEALAKRLQGHYDALYGHVMDAPVIGLDQTSWKRLEHQGKPWQMWCLTTPAIVYHRICDDKSAPTFTKLVGTFVGTIVCDALKTHEAGAREGPGIELAGCWAHVFRKFDEAQADHPEAALATKWIGELYAIDARAGEDVALRAELRRTESAAVLATMKSWLWSQAALKTLSIGNAAAYTIANWDRLGRFVHDVRVPLDNNQTERGIRGPVIGRRNHFGSKSRRGTEVAAIFYSLLETAKLHRVEPARYLADAVRAADRGEIIMPWQTR